MASQAQIEQLREQGYFIADNAVEPEMLDDLEAATKFVPPRWSTTWMEFAPAGRG